jgi:serine/threonine-protein kinase
VPLASTRIQGNERLARQLRGDIDNVLAKALAKDAARRYPSVEALAADVQRYLDGEAVIAQPRSRSYYIAKFVRRHRLPITAFGAVAVALVAGAGAALWQAQEAKRQSDVARSRLAQTEASIDFISMVLTEGPQAGEAVTLEELVKRSGLVETFRSGRSSVLAPMWLPDGSFRTATTSAPKSCWHARLIRCLPRSIPVS